MYIYLFIYIDRYIYVCLFLQVQREPARPLAQPLLHRRGLLLVDRNQPAHRYRGGHRYRRGYRGGHRLPVRYRGGHPYQGGHPYRGGHRVRRGRSQWRSHGGCSHRGCSHRGCSHRGCSQGRAACACVGGRADAEGGGAAQGGILIV